MSLKNSFMETSTSHRQTTCLSLCGTGFVSGNWTIYDNFITDADPGFVDAEALNFGLRENSEVFRRVPGFKPIPFDQIGLRHDEFRSGPDADPSGPNGESSGHS